MALNANLNFHCMITSLDKNQSGCKETKKSKLSGSRPQLINRVLATTPESTDSLLLLLQ